MNIFEKLDNNSIGEAILAAVPEPFFVFDEEGQYVSVIGGADRQKYHNAAHLVGKYIHDVIEKELADLFVGEIQKAISLAKVHTYVYSLAAADIKGSESLPGPQGKQWFEAHISPVAGIDGKPRMVVWVAFSITSLQNTLQEKESLIAELQEATREIQTLKGILPICSYCKKIRDDNGHWNQLERYIHKHSEANFSHSICPQCLVRHYPEYDIR